jgi:hypothetical protein
MLSPYNKNKNAKMLQHYKICLNWFYSYQDWYIVPTLWFNWFLNNNSPFTKRRAENKIGWKELCLVSYLDVNMSNSATQVNPCALWRGVHTRTREFDTSFYWRTLLNYCFRIRVGWLFHCLKQRNFFSICVLELIF